MLSRESQLNDIIKFISDSESKVESMLQELEWTAADTMEDDCDERDSANFESPREKSTVDDPLYPPAYPWQHSVNLDKGTLNGVIKSDNPKDVPNKFSDSQVNLNREERLLIYEYVIKRTGKLLEPELSVTLNQEEGSKMRMTFAEIVAFKRDLKRRRMRHRTTKEPPLSYTEEVRNLIEVQMQALNQYLHPEKDETEVLPKQNTPGPSREELGKDNEKPIGEQRRNRPRSRSKSEERWYYKKKESKKSRHNRSPKDSTEAYSPPSKKSTKKMKRRGECTDVGLC